MSRTCVTKAVVRQNLWEIVDLLAIERLLSQTTILRVTLDFIEERGLGHEYAKFLDRRSR